MMAERIVAIRRVLRVSGSVFLHCDPTASHYLKIVMDAVFGPECFRNEIVWRYRRWPTKARRFQRMHDVILFYTRAPATCHTFHTLYGYEDLAESTKKTFGNQKQRADFSTGHRKPGLSDEATPGPPLSDVWEIGVIAAKGKERLGYPTQKPEAMLERIIRASSNKGDLVADFFCGSGTTSVVAAKNDRKFITSDESVRAAYTARNRLVETQAVFSLERDSLIKNNTSYSAKKINLFVSADSVRLKTILDVDFWEVDPDWDGEVFKSAAQAQRPVRSGDIPLELKIKIGRRVCVRLVTVQGEEIQLDV